MQAEATGLPDGATMSDAAPTEEKKLSKKLAFSFPPRGTPMSGFSPLLASG